MEEAIDMKEEEKVKEKRKSEIVEIKQRKQKK